MFEPGIGDSLRAELVGHEENPLEKRIAAAANADEVDASEKDTAGMDEEKFMRFFTSMQGVLPQMTSEQKTKIAELFRQNN